MDNEKHLISVTIKRKDNELSESVLVDDNNSIIIFNNGSWCYREKFLFHNMDLFFKKESVLFKTKDKDVIKSKIDNLFKTDPILRFYDPVIVNVTSITGSVNLN